MNDNKERRSQMDTINDGTKYDGRNNTILGFCTCYCGTQSFGDGQMAGYDNHTCGCACSAWTQEQYNIGLNIEP